MHQVVLLGLLIGLSFFPILPSQQSEPELRILQELRRLNPGTIVGRVLDPDGNPVANASVIATLADTSQVHIGVVPSTTTDEEGRFVLEYVKLGTSYLIEASKEDDGYLHTCVLILDCPSAGTCPKVTLTWSTRRADVVVRFGPRAVFNCIYQ